MTAIDADAQVIAQRMDRQREQLRSQFLRPPPEPATETAPMTPNTALQPYEPRSLLMQLLLAHPQLLRRMAVLATTTVLGARYSSWVLQLLGLLVFARQRRR